MTEAPLLDVRSVTTVLDERTGALTVLDSVSFTVGAGERVAIVGESGSGKSTTALSIIGLLPMGMRHESGEILFSGIDLAALPSRQLRTFRGRSIAVVFQDALQALDPVATIGNQVASVARRHERGLSRSGARARAIELLADVGFPSPEQFIGRYPHQLSGGMRQRALIAASLAGNPTLLIADEPTSALDVTVQAQIIELLIQLSTDRGLAVLLITHDLAIVAGFAHRTVVMYGGRVVESGTTAEIFAEPHHPYTRGLLACVPRIDDDADGPLSAIRGQPPSLADLPVGCAFAPRCADVHERCRTERPSLKEVERGMVACHLREASVRA